MNLTGFGEVEGVDLLQKLPLFSRLSFEEAGRLAAILQHVDVGPGTVLIEQNSLADALWILKEGSAEVSREVERDGLRTEFETLGTLGPGDLVGEMSLVDELLTSARVRTTTACRLLKIPRKDFEALLGRDDKLAVKVFQCFCRTLSDRLRKANLTKGS